MNFNKITESDLARILKENNSKTKFPYAQMTSKLSYYNVLKMTFNERSSIGLDDPDNMQDDGACFEGWAAILYTYYMKKTGTIVLDTDFEDFDFDPDTTYLSKNLHYMRFLYRALRFSEQYKEWFRLEGKIKIAVDGFKKYLASCSFINNIPDQDNIEKPADNKRESIIEKKFAEEKSEKLLKLSGLNSSGNVYRQLPVGLFKDTVADNTRIFPSGFIDLWTTDGDTFYLYELKAKNKMVGAITELFFYSNYAYDVFIGSRDKSSPFKLNRNIDPKEKYRGYDELLDKSAELDRVKGFLLLDEGKDGSVHPFITKKVLDVLNSTARSEGNYHAPDITYGMVKYNYDYINK